MGAIPLDQEQNGGAKMRLNYFSIFAGLDLLRIFRARRREEQDGKSMATTGRVASNDKDYTRK